MSGRIVGLVLDNGPREVTEALLLTSLAEKSGENGYSWPGVETLARRTRRTQRQVLRLLKKLAAQGWITIHPRAEGFGRKQTAYTLNMTRLESAFSSDVVVSHEKPQPVWIAATSPISGDMKASHQVSGDISAHSQVTSEPISGDISSSCNKRKLRTLEPSAADASTECVPLPEEQSDKHSPKPHLVKPAHAEGPAPPHLILPEWLDSVAWDGFVEMRRKIRKPLTDDAKSLAIRKLEKLKAEGHSPSDVIDQSTLNSWTAFWPLKCGQGGTSPEMVTAPRQKTAIELMKEQRNGTR